MRNAERRHDPDSSQAPHSRCLASPHCDMPPSIARRFGGLDGLWLHLGPIDTESTPLVVHRAERPPSAANGGRLDVPTRTSHRRFLGCSVDLFGLNHNPGGEARRYVQSVGGSRESIYVVYAVAWCDTDGVSIRWKAPGFGLPEQGYNTNYGSSRPSPALEREVERLTHLLDGGGRRRGRPSRWDNPLWREIGLRAIDRKNSSPGLTWALIAEAQQVPLSTLRDWVRILRDERARGIRVMEGGAE
jgi:hypothetical protein